jgi:hypothetical protein
MGYADKQQTLIRFLLTAANSALGYGDKFGTSAVPNVLNTLAAPACQHMGSVSALSKQLEHHTFTGTANGLQNAAAYLPAERSLVFLLSDCHFPLPQLRAVLGSLQGHDVIPLVLWNQDEYVTLPNWGLIAFQDMENNATRTLFMRPALRQKIIAAIQQRQHDLKHIFRALAASPCLLRNAIAPKPLIVICGRELHENSVNQLVLSSLLGCSVRSTRPVSYFNVETPRPFGYVNGDEIPSALSSKPVRASPQTGSLHPPKTNQPLAEPESGHG